MAQFAPNDCQFCNEPSPVSRANAKLIVFLAHPRCTHIEVICPNCDQPERFFNTPHEILRVKAQLELKVVLIPVAPPEFQEFCDVAHERNGNDLPGQEPAVPGPRTEAELPDLPNQLRRELYDWFRELS